MLNSSFATLKFSEIDSISSYLSDKDVKRLYANLLYHLTLYQPNDPIQFMIDHLKIMNNNKNNSPYNIELKKPKIIFLIDSNLSQNSLLGRELALKYKFYYMQLQSLVEKEIYSKSELGIKLDQALKTEAWKEDENFYSLQGASAQLDAQRNERNRKSIERNQKMKIFSKELQLNLEHEDFIVDGFPSRLDEALWFENDISEPRLVLFIRQERDPEISDEEWENNQNKIKFLKEYYNFRFKWVEIEGENDNRSIEDVINDIDSLLV